ncbi:hypothetical protein [Paenibacillus sp. J22TS3]|uniref:hypothetical protein n=1 Tax=Paenibacillus sp. J22TS3 TaxID=2807192 RepID=UPI001B237803|nr:hypothetical protein [Paenibacillus sp. J22TS3]GIP21302.1 hypothetical protein J22TS3_15770 [Paenibacillus sp. J22TS3]
MRGKKTKRSASAGKAAPRARAKQPHPNRVLADKWKGVPVCIVTKDGSLYVGTITHVDEKAVSVAGVKGAERVRRSDSKQQVQVSGLLDLLFGKSPVNAAAPASNAVAAEAGGAGGASPASFGSFFSNIKLGIGMLQTIMPLLGSLKI